MFENQLVQIAIVTVAMMVLVGMAGYGLKVFDSYIKSTSLAPKYTILKDKARSVVRFLEQAPGFQGEPGALKKEYAMGYLIQAARNAGIEVLENAAAGVLDKMGFSISRDEIDHMVEEAVLDMNAEFGKFLNDYATPAEG
jgi:hypothetical protein